MMPCFLFKFLSVFILWFQWISVIDISGCAKFFECWEVGSQMFLTLLSMCLWIKAIELPNLSLIYDCCDMLAIPFSTINGRDYWYSSFFGHRVWSCQEDDGCNTLGTGRLWIMNCACSVYDTKKCREVVHLPITLLLVGKLPRYVSTTQAKEQLMSNHWMATSHEHISQSSPWTHWPCHWESVYLGKDTFLTSLMKSRMYTDSRALGSRIWGWLCSLEPLASWGPIEYQ